MALAHFALTSKKSFMIRCKHMIAIFVEYSRGSGGCKVTELCKNLVFLFFNVLPSVCAVKIFSYLA